MDFLLTLGVGSMGLYSYSPNAKELLTEEHRCHSDLLWLRDSSPRPCHLSSEDQCLPGSVLCDQNNLDVPFGDWARRAVLQRRGPEPWFLPCHHSYFVASCQQLFVTSSSHPTLKGQRIPLPWPWPQSRGDPLVV